MQDAYKINALGGGPMVAVTTLRSIREDLEDGANFDDTTPNARKWVLEACDEADRIREILAKREGK